MPSYSSLRFVSLQRLLMNRDLTATSIRRTPWRFQGAVRAVHERARRGRCPAGLSALAILALTVIVACEAQPAVVGRGPPAPSAPSTESPLAKPLPNDPTAPPTIQLGLIAVDRVAGSVRVPGVVALREGWLEQAVCREGTRDHESLVTVSMPPSSIHAALLLAGFQPGRPGHWRVRDDGSLELVAPTGEAVLIEVEWSDATGCVQRVPLADWIRADASAVPLSFVFAGSVTRDRGAMPYAADRSGSVIGLVTFGDEPLANVTVMPDRADVAEPSLRAWTERMPTVGTAVTVVMRRAMPHAP